MHVGRPTTVSLLPRASEQQHLTAHLTAPYSTLQLFTLELAVPAVAFGFDERDHDTEDRLHRIDHLQPAQGEARQGEAHACEDVRSRPAWDPAC